MLNSTISPRVKKILHTAKDFPAIERLILVKLLLDDLICDETGHIADWSQMGLAAFNKDWDNPDDAVYDNWREVYNVSTRQGT